MFREIEGGRNAPPPPPRKPLNKLWVSPLPPSLPLCSMPSGLIFTTTLNACLPGPRGGGCDPRLSQCPQLLPSWRIATHNKHRWPLVHMKHKTILKSLKVTVCQHRVSYLLSSADRVNTVHAHTVPTELHKHIFQYAPLISTHIL